MEYVIRPDIFPMGAVTAFFTGKSPGVDAKRISEISGFDEKKIYLPIQRHTAEVVDVDEGLIPSVADASITGMAGVLVGVKVADCVPVLLYSKTGLIAAVHAGWKGTAQGVLKATLRKMLSRSTPGDIFIAIGPAIRWCCYKVGEDVMAAVINGTGEGDYHILRGGAVCLDLPSANRVQAMSLGVPGPNIWMSEECTYCLPERFNSYRFMKGSAQRQGGFIGLIKKEG